MLVSHRKREYLPGFASGSLEGEARWTFLTGFAGFRSLDRSDVCSRSCWSLDLGVSVGGDSMHDAREEKCKWKRKTFFSWKPNAEVPWINCYIWFSFQSMSSQIGSAWTLFLQAPKARASSSSSYYSTQLQKLVPLPEVKLTVIQTLLTKKCKED